MNLSKSLGNPVSISFLKVMETPEDQCVKSFQSLDAYLVNPIEDFSFWPWTIFAKKIRCNAQLECKNASQVKNKDNRITPLMLLTHVLLT